jgi:hypothetical protein
MRRSSQAIPKTGLRCRGDNQPVEDCDPCACSSTGRRRRRSSPTSARLIHWLIRRDEQQAVADALARFFDQVGP